ncbi:carbohydrate ABC transporter permease [Paenarthrobacter nicotinovorans]|uniref:carbohydrate ABC transporter permease n=1 Tax=Paenarthrobacter nicotinovorans TaxID=29320 RepID=UPI00380DB039
MRSMYPSWFYIPAAALFVVFFAVPTFASLYFSLTRWSLFDVTFIGFDNFVQFFQDQQLLQGFTNTLVYGFVTSAAKVVLGFGLALLLTSAMIGRGYLRSVIFFPVLVSTIGVGLTFKVLLDPFNGLLNTLLAGLGIDGPGWLTDPGLALFTVAAVDVWKGLGIATLIYIAGIVAIPQEYFEAARVDGASSWNVLRNITIPLSWPATGTVIILSLIGGLRSFDLIWAMTKGGPGFSSDVIASVIYKQYQAGFYGLSTAGNVVLFLVVTAILIPISYLINKKGSDA